MENFFNNIVSSIGIMDVLDILIVAFIVYKVLGFIRETRAEQLAKGLAILVVMTLASRALHLYTLNWILSGLMTVGLLAIVVIFQPELRRALEAPGQEQVRQCPGRSRQRRSQAHGPRNGGSYRQHVRLQDRRFNCH